ncbi:LysR family transcriptional regulator [Neogemmobacter tilapiae]|uniref:LysR family transcriptional regulator n=1 Tax=Neogemmobacter tilapiae TaxID=875041 RepID=A0A918TQ81_9RHOB|nr:LysR family transcriptional regulator [Gemmobacter tilapiae]GHC56078.1 LysR family transcriptional regulator [Gemmobacter tilapiae]
MPSAPLNEIQVFVAVVEKASFVAGGRRLGLSRSAAGKAVARLEEHLGVRLLHRTTRAVSLTDEGRVFLDHAQGILSAVEQAEASVSRAKARPRGVLRLTLPDGLGRMLILPLVQRYLADWPEVQVEISLADRLADLVDEGFDLALRVGVTTADTGLVARVVTRLPVVLCAAPGYLAQRGIPETLTDLARHDGLIFSSRGQRQIWRFADGQKVALPSRLRMDSAEALRAAALADMGIAQLPKALIERDLARGDLVVLLPDATKAEVNLVALYPEKRLLEPRVRRFIDLLATQLP